MAPLSSESTRPESAETFVRGWASYSTPLLLSQIFIRTSRQNSCVNYLVRYP
jgi:hypothetical protein